LKHLDGRDVVIKTKPGQIIHPETTDDETGRTLPYLLQVNGEGMPSKGNPFVKGNLYIAFHVKFPQSLPASTMAQLKQLLPEPTSAQDLAYDKEHTEEHFMEMADLRHFGKGGAAAHSDNYDSDDEEGGARGQGVQCQQS
jgi:DnaJ homolog subfamily A member 2